MFIGNCKTREVFDIGYNVVNFTGQFLEILENVSYGVLDDYNKFHKLLPKYYKNFSTHKLTELYDFVSLKCKNGFEKFSNESYLGAFLQIFLKNNKVNPAFIIGSLFEENTDSQEFPNVIGIEFLDNEQLKNVLSKYPKIINSNFMLLSKNKMMQYLLCLEWTTDFLDMSKYINYFSGDFKISHYTPNYFSGDFRKTLYREIETRYNEHDNFTFYYKNIEQHTIFTIKELKYIVSLIENIINIRK